jgi:hypothetical protein
MTDYNDDDDDDDDNVVDDDEYKCSRKHFGNELVTCILGCMFGVIILMTDHQ